MANESAPTGKKVMIAIDESETSYHALMWLIENLRETIVGSGNPLLIFLAQPRPGNTNVFAASLGSARMFCNVSGTAEYVNSVQGQTHLVSMGILDKAKSICTSHGVDAETITVIGDAREAICDAVKELKINLLVLGDHGIGKIKRALLGSVSEHCVHNAKCPVLVVKKPDLQ